MFPGGRSGSTQGKGFAWQLPHGPDTQGAHKIKSRHAVYGHVGPQPAGGARGAGVIARSTSGTEPGVGSLAARREGPSSFVLSNFQLFKKGLGFEYWPLLLVSPWGTVGLAL